MSEILDDSDLLKPKEPKKEKELIFKPRNTLITIWLFLTIFSCLWVVILHIPRLLDPESLTTPDQIIKIFICLLSFAKIYFVYHIFWWKKSAFYGFVICSLLIFGINILRMDFFSTLVIPVIIMFHYIILQLKSEGVSAWDNLE